MTIKVHQLFQAACERDPQAVAVETDTESISYGDLDRKADTLAAGLWTTGVRAGDCVGGYFPHGSEMPVALLALSKISATFVPIGSENPGKVRQDIVRTSEIRRVLGTRGSITELEDLPVTLIDIEKVPTAGTDDQLPDPSVDTPAMVIHTSGSTGVPRGVIWPHSMFGPLVKVFREMLEFGPGARVLQFGSTGHGNLYNGLIATLGSGATACFADYYAMMPGPDLARTLRQRRISHIHLPPTSLAELPEGDYPDLKVMSLGGEFTGAALVSKWRGQAKILVDYGTTETNWFCCAEAPASGEISDPLPLGLPIDGAEGRVVDEDGQEVADGSQGELVIRARHVSPGYTDTSLAAGARFFTDPDTGIRQFRTGDRFLRRADGQFVALGRLDDQLKIRGYRVEPSAIEASLEGLEGISAARVLNAGNTERPRLAAFIVAEPSPELKALIAYMKEQQPAYMVPADYYLVDRIPLLMNGKCDRLALLERARLGVGRLDGKRLDAPASQTERWLADTWSEILEIRVTDSEDDFFDLGGDSLSAVQVVNRVQTERGQSLELKVLFDYSRLREFAAVLDGGTTAAGASSPDNRSSVSNPT